MNPKSDKVELSDLDLENFCKKNGYKFPGIVFLKSIKANKTCFVFTGTTPDEYNNGHTHHWMFLYKGLLFDSYGNYKNTFKVPDDNIIWVNKKRLQQFDSSVCGEYCCSFYDYINQTSKIDMVEYKNTYELGLDQNQNDHNILQWYKSQNVAS